MSLTIDITVNNYSWGCDLLYLGSSLTTAGVVPYCRSYAPKVVLESPKSNIETSVPQGPQRSRPTERKGIFALMKNLFVLEISGADIFIKVNGVATLIREAIKKKVQMQALPGREVRGGWGCSTLAQMFSEHCFRG